MGPTDLSFNPSSNMCWLADLRQAISPLEISSSLSVMGIIEELIESERPDCLAQRSEQHLLLPLGLPGGKTRHAIVMGL